MLGTDDENIERERERESIECIEFEGETDRVLLAATCPLPPVPNAGLPSTVDGLPHDAARAAEFSAIVLFIERAELGWGTHLVRERGVYERFVSANRAVACLTVNRGATRSSRTGHRVAMRGQL